MRLLRQTWTLTTKNWLIVLFRSPIATIIRCLVIPLALMIFLSFAKNLFVPPAVFGVGRSHQIRTLPEALALTADTGRDTVAFFNSGFRGGDIDRVIDALVPVVEGAGATAVRLNKSSELNTVCKSTLRGVTPCYGALILQGSPSEGGGGIWNYTLRSDGALGSGKVNVDKDTNDGELYTLPFQHAVDAAIVGLDAAAPPFPSNVQEYPFTSLTEDERADQIRIIYQSSITNFLGVSFIVGVIGICYHLTGFMAAEREIGMSTLVEAMMATQRRWEGQAARLISYHVSFSILYMPGWVIGSVILARSVFAHTSVATILFYHILVGLALASMSIFGASFFSRSQLSGVTVTIVYIVLAIIAQTVSYPSSATVAVLSLLFAPCNYVYFITYVARFEQVQWPTDLTKSAPGSPWSLPGIALWIFLILQILIYPVLGALIENYLHGAGTGGRTLLFGEAQNSADTAVRLEGFTKIYKPGFIRRMFGWIVRAPDPVYAVNGLSLTAHRGQILALLGANGSGKSTTLDAIAGTNQITSGSIMIDGTGGLGIAPQKNVLWDDLTVEEHVRIFNKLKSPLKLDSRDEIRQLVVSVDLELKMGARSKTLSGGQKRKLQLGMMLTGGSAVCCVDEVSSGLDPISRRKIWDILLAERGRRTIIMTTHFLDEADLLSDYIAVLSKGTLRAEGSPVELKERFGGGYRIHVHKTKTLADGPDIDGVIKKNAFDTISYTATSSALAARVIKTLEDAGITDYRFSGPTIEDVFLHLAEEIQDESSSLGEQLDARGADLHQQYVNNEKVPSPNVVISGGDDASHEGLKLLSGRRIGYFQQARVLFLKRCTVFKHNWFPYFAAFIIPIIAAGLVTLFVKNQQPVGCTPTAQGSDEQQQSVFNSSGLFLVAGPASRFTPEAASLFLPIIQSDQTLSKRLLSRADNSSSIGVLQNFLSNITLANTFDDFNNLIIQDRKNITPAGWWLGDASSPPTVAYRANAIDQINSLYGQALLDVMLANMSISANYAPFDIPWAPDTGNSLQLLVYVALAAAAYPGFFALYPNVERRRNVRGLEYSNGVRVLPLWMAYVAFDFAIVLVSSAIVTGLFAGLSSVWYHVGYLFLIFMLYGLASILLAYVISLFSKNQLSAYAFTAAGQAVMFLVYLIAYLATITYAPVNRVDEDLLLVNFLVSVFAPIGSVTRALFLALNLFSTTCTGNAIAPNPGGIVQYGGPILYLCVQSVVLFLLLVWFDSGNVGSTLRNLFKRRRAALLRSSTEHENVSDEEVANELVRVVSSTRDPDDANPADDGLRVLHVTKTFGHNTAVENVTFGIKRGEVFALLGPNGAGKSTTISMIRGDVRPDDGDVFVEDASVTRRLAAARANLGVCPQFDAVDQMTVREHLDFYARVRGIPDAAHNVAAVVQAVGLQAFQDRQAHALSGGNKRKLSLGIALMGNPTVVLLDEPSSGLDAAAKRIMWKTLAATVPGRSILLTTHSMEEADALAGRAGILARRMLAMGTTEQLRARFGDRLHVHLVCRGAPRTSEADTARVRDWVLATFPGAEVEEKTYHGQMRFSIPPADVMLDQRGGGGGGGGGGGTPHKEEEKEKEKKRRTEDSITEVGGSAAAPAYTSQGALSKMVVLLDEQRDALGIDHYSVSPTTLDQVFLNVVGRHNVQEEGYREEHKKKKSAWRCGL